MGIAEKHAQAVKDHAYLDQFAKNHMTGEGHDCVEIDAEVFHLMANPTKAHALSLYESSISGWFWHWGQRLPADQRLAEIADRYFCEYAHDYLAYGDLKAGDE